MSKLFVVLLIVSLILSTALIKNSTKRVDDEIFVLRENIRGLRKDFEDIALENNYLSSSEKLIEFQNLYFDKELIKKEIQEIKKIKRNFDEIKISQFNFSNE